MNKVASGIILVVALAVMGGVVYFFANQSELPPPPPPPLTKAVEAPPPAPKPVENPIAEAPAAQPLPALADSDALLADVLTQIFGARAVRENFIVQGGVRRIVATVDNLTREKLPQQLWPVRPVGGEFKVQTVEQGTVIGVDNAARYAGYVKLLESVDTAQAARLYAQMYPLFQQAYRELGYPNGYFNDRLVQVIDHLLLTPEPAQPIALVQPKVRYEYADPTLASLSAGQKVLVRTGPENERRIKAKLREFRAAVAARPR